MPELTCHYCGDEPVVRYNGRMACSFHARFMFWDEPARFWKLLED